MHGSLLAKVGVFQKEVEALGLADERAAVGRHVDDVALFELVGGFVSRV